MYATFGPLAIALCVFDQMLFARLLCSHVFDVLERKFAMMKLLVKHMSVLNLFAQTSQGNTPLV